MGVVLTFFNVLLILEFALGSEWSYAGDAGPSHWYQDYPVCKENRQSPINIETEKATDYDDILPVHYHGYEGTLTGGTIVNNGHTVTLSMPSGKTFTISGGGFDPDRYRALQLHFHWAPAGSTDGSEHTINGKHFPLEMHIVHIKEPYNSVEAVKGMTDGLAVLGVMFDIGSEENVPLQKVLDDAKKLKYAGSRATLTDGPRLEELLPSSTTFYRYFGSLTTPPCYETVTWTVFSEPLFITQSQLAVLQSLKSITPLANASESDGLGGNFRPVQPLNGREVIFAGEYVEEVAVVQPSILLIVLSCLVGLFIFIAMIAVVKRCCCEKKGKDSSVIYKA